MDNLLISVVDVISDFKLYLKKKNDKLILRKESKEGFISKKIENIKYKNGVEIFSNEVNYFAMMLRNNFNRETLINFEKNIRTLFVYGVYFQLNDFGSFTNYGSFLGRYDAIKNSISIDLSKDKNKSSIYHELFHMASTRRGDIMTGSGFRYFKSDKVSYGRGLNEGYTDILTQRYFYSKDYELSYKNEYIYALLLERIVGKEKMENFYLSGNISGLIYELEKYNTLDNIYYFIKALDNIGKSDGILIDAQRIKGISQFLIESYIRKKKVNGENIYDNKTSMDVFNYIQSIPTTIEIEGKKRTISLTPIVDEIVETEFPQNNMGIYR